MGRKGRRGSLDGKGLTVGLVAARYNEEIVDLLKPLTTLTAGHSEELVDWIKRAIRAFGATLESAED